MKPTFSILLCSTLLALPLVVATGCGGSGGSSEVCISTESGVQCGEGNRQDSPNDSNNDNSDNSENEPG